jgi:hypothetical protein
MLYALTFLSPQVLECLSLIIIIIIIKVLKFREGVEFGALARDWSAM